MNLLNICLCFGLIAVVFLYSADAQSQSQFDQRGVATSGGKKSLGKPSLLPTTTRRSSYAIGGTRRRRRPSHSSPTRRRRLSTKRSTPNPNGKPQYPPTQYPVTQDLTRRG